MLEDRPRWTDARLDDRFMTVADELRGLRDLPRGIAEIAIEVRHLKDDTDACHVALRELRDDFQTYVEEQIQTHEAHRLERKSDRRWMIGSIFTAAGLVIAAMSILVSHL